MNELFASRNLLLSVFVDRLVIELFALRNLLLSDVVDRLVIELFALRNLLLSDFVDRLVIETLKEVQPDRRCYRMVGGVLVERTVGDVLPTLTTNKQQVTLDNPTMQPCSLSPRLDNVYVYNVYRYNRQYW